MVNYVLFGLMWGSNYKGPGRPLGEIDPNSTTFMLDLTKLAISGYKQEG